MENDLCSCKTIESETICILRKASEVIIIQKTGYQGHYHILGNLISPIDGIGPEALNIDSLMKRLGNIKEIIIATDASVEVIQRAVDLNADILICHHGLTWTNGNISLPNSGDLESPRTKIAIENNLTIIGLHLPMDAHPTLGNNAVLSEVIGAEISGTWFNTKGTH